MTGLSRDVADALPYQYVVLRCVPRVDREEFLNVGVALYCQSADFLDAAAHVDRARLAAFGPGIDADRLERSLAAVRDVCRGVASAGDAARADLGTRFGFVKAPRSTIVQPGPVHGGLTTDPGRELEHLLDRLVR
ncbi:DUF3037 domain-containing protein [Nocardioides massiliensis]|uniref:DUF3037 domain-containing protein n=1 Tax=Nocardioides massiliensis TaxID=1325935 RepID=A0ABT9NQP1_9ACTN|nr:DUF3037 domain-containing protein [Nocardioides massiliensis]MDP9822745.1 hypothetical protein [Nocardioides massiliensis]